MKFEKPQMVRLEKNTKPNMYGGESSCSTSWSSCCYGWH